MTVRVPAIGLALLGVAWVAWAAETSAARPAGRAAVTYRSGGSVYVGAGRLDGLAPGDTIQVLRADGALVRILVRDLSSHSAVCDTLPGSGGIAPGDSVRFAIRAASPAVSPPPAATAAPAAAPADAGPGSTSSGTADSLAVPGGFPAPAGPAMVFRGRLGLTWIGVWNDAADARLERPAGSLWLLGRNLGGLPIDADVDLRARGSTWNGTGETTKDPFRGRLYRGALSAHTQSHSLRLVLGRQMSTSFSSVSLFDGVLVEGGDRRWIAGAHLGTLPDPATLAFSQDVRQLGLYAGMRSNAGAAANWAATLGAVTSTQEGETNRDFLFAQGHWRRGTVALYFAQEVDVLRDWRKEPGGSALSFTSTLLNGRGQVVRGVTLRAGFDGRRSVRIYADRLTPEDAFDDRARQGAWLGASWEATRQLTIDAEGRGRFGSGDEEGAGASLALSGRRLTALRLHARVRAAMFHTDDLDQRLVTLGLGGDPRPDLHVELAGGVRGTEDRLQGVATDTWWGSAQADWSPGQRWYVSGAFTREDGDLGTLREIDLGTGVRF